MLYGSKFSAGPATAQLKEDGGIYAREANIGAFARDWGLKVCWPQSWTVQGLVDVLAAARPRWSARCPWAMWWCWPGSAATEPGKAR
jgi:hypothetical protein